MPEQPRGDGAPRPPRLADRAPSRRRRADRPSPLTSATGLRERDVADRPDIGPPEDHQQVDRRGPRPDPGHRLERVLDVGVVEVAEPVEVERPGLDRRRQRAPVARLLAAEPDGEELAVVEREEAARA